MIPAAHISADLLDAVASAVKTFNAMSAPDKVAATSAQRRSWVVGELILAHPDMSRANAEAIYDRVVNA